MLLEKLFLSGIFLRAGVLFVSALLLLSCQTVIDGNLSQNGRAELKIQTALSGKTSALLSRLAAHGGTESAAPLLDAALFNQSLQRQPGIEHNSWTQKTPGSVEGQIVVRKIDEIVSAEKLPFPFIVWKQSEKGGYAAFRLNREQGQLLVNLISPDFADYLSALMAPLATGEDLSKAEYQSLVTSVYGKAIADELEHAQFKMNLTFPQVISSINGGKKNGRTALVQVPLIDLLVLEEPFLCEVSWGN